MWGKDAGVLFCGKALLMRNMKRLFQNLNSVFPAEDLLEMLIRLHRGGFYHGDLNYRNLYRTADGRFGLIDLDAMQLYPGLVPFRLRMKELARIISSGVQAEQIRSWSRIRSLAAEQCALYKEKSSLSCDPDLVTKIVCANLKHTGKRYGIQYYE